MNRIIASLLIHNQQQQQQVHYLSLSLAPNQIQQPVAGSGFMSFIYNVRLFVHKKSASTSSGSCCAVGAH